MNNAVNEKINKELIKIQDELSALDNAVKQVEKAESVANDVIKSVKELQHKYGNHLDTVTKEVGKLINTTNSKANNFVSDLYEKHKKQMEEVAIIFEKFHKDLVSTQYKNNSLINKTLSKTDSQIYQISSSHHKQIEEVNEMLRNYDDLAKSTVNLNEEVKQVNFPKRLGNIESAAKQLNQVQVQLKKDFGEFEIKNNTVLKNTRKSKRRATAAMIFSILTFIAVLGIGLDVLLKYFPNLWDFLK